MMSGTFAGVNIHREMTKKFKAVRGASSPSDRNSNIRVLTGLSNCQFPSISYSEGYLRPESITILSFLPQQMMMELGKQRRVASDMVHPHSTHCKDQTFTQATLTKPYQGKKAPPSLGHNVFLHVGPEFCLAALNTMLKCFVALETRRKVLSVGKASLRAGNQAGPESLLPHSPGVTADGKFSSFLVTSTHFYLEGLQHRLPATSPSLTILTCGSEQAGHEATTHTLRLSQFQETTQTLVGTRLPAQHDSGLSAAILKGKSGDPGNLREPFRCS